MRRKEDTGIYRAAAYIRLSREDGDKEESDSVGNQRKLLLDYIHGKAELLLHDIYVDDGFSGTNFRRPGFQKMIADIEAGKVNCVIVKDLSRFGRDYIETGRYLERIFPEWKVRFIALTDGIDSARGTYDLLLPIHNIMNEQYARDISKKVTAAIRTKQCNGEFIGAFACYGYRKSPQDKNKLVIDEYAAAVVRRIFSLYLQGYGKVKIAGLLNEEGILCPSEYKKRNGDHYCNSKKLQSTNYWTYSAVNVILQREMYLGNMVQGKTHQRMRGRHMAVDREEWVVVENTHAPIIDRDTWEKAQSLLNRRTRTPDLKNNVHMLAGYVKCGDCGRAMAKNVRYGPDGTRVVYLSCGTYKRCGTQYCTSHTVRLKDLENLILQDLQNLVRSREDLQQLVKNQVLTEKRNGRSGHEKPDKIQAELERVKRLKKSVYEDYREGLLTREEYLDFREDYIGKEQLYKNRLKLLENQRKEEQEENSRQCRWIRDLLENKNVECLDRECVVEMVDEISVYEDGGIRIRYNFSREA